VYSPLNLFRYFRFLVLKISHKWSGQSVLPSLISGQNTIAVDIEIFVSFSLSGIQSSPAPFQHRNH
jgi:hypothetical protein